MTNKKRIVAAILAMCIVSCGDNSNANSMSEGNESSGTQNSQPICDSSTIEEADPNGFDPNFDYVGTSIKDFRVIASRYSGNPYFVPEPYLMQGEHSPWNLDYCLIIFPFRGSSVVAWYKGGKIFELHRFQSGKMTISAAKSLGFVDEAHVEQSESYVYCKGSKETYGKPSSTKRYVKEFFPALSDVRHRNGIGDYIDFFTKYGIPTSMLVYYDGDTSDYINDQIGHTIAGVTIDYASAIPIYSDDLSEIVGVITIGIHDSVAPSYTFAYLKEDGFGEIQSIRSINYQIINKPSVEIIQNPRFYIEDTSLLPRPDWRIILGYDHDDPLWN